MHANAHYGLINWNNNLKGMKITHLPFLIITTKYWLNWNAENK